MLNQCPHCQQAITLSDGQRQKIEEAYARLQPGGALKVGCPRCGQPIQLKKEQGFAPTPSMDDLIPPLDGGSSDPFGGQQSGMGERPMAPNPPDTSWLASGKYEEKEEVKDVPKALILMPEGQAKTAVSSAFVELFYQVMQARTATEGIEQLRYIDFSAIVLHSGFEAGGIVASPFHQHMCRMNMSKRRNIYYALMGPEMHTFYNLEAMSFGANLVINDRDAQHMKTIIRKGLQERDELFGPFLQALKALGKK